MNSPVAFRGADGSLVKLSQQSDLYIASPSTAVVYPQTVTALFRNSLDERYRKHKDQGYFLSGVRLWSDAPVLDLRAFEAVKSQRQNDRASSARRLELEDQHQDYFSPSADLVRLILSSQAEGLTERTLIDNQLKAEIGERIIESFADYAWRRQEAEELSIELAQFEADGRLAWCDNALAKILLFEANVAFLRAEPFLSAVFLEVVDFLQKGVIRGDWGELVGRDRNLRVLVPGSRTR